MIDTTRFTLPYTDAGKHISSYVQRNPSCRHKRYWGAVKVPSEQWNYFATVKPIMNGTGLLVDVCAPKFLFGHNVFGPNDARLLIERVLKVVLRRLVGPSYSPICLDDVMLSRIDLAMGLHLDHGVSVADSLAALHSVLFRQGVSLKVFERYREVQSIYINPMCEREGILFYNKLRELQHRPLADELDGRERIMKWTARTLRFERRLQRDALNELGLRHLRSWTPAIARRLLADGLERAPVTGTGQAIPRKRHFHKLSPRLRKIASAHHNGADLNSVFEPRSLRKARDQIVSIADYDIYVAPAGKQGMSLSRLVRDASVRRRGYPTWAKAVYRQPG